MTTPMPRQLADAPSEGRPSQRVGDRIPRSVFLLLALQAGLLAWSALERSPVTVEVPELAAGYYHLMTGRFSTAVVNPPLVRCMAAAPLLFIQPRYDFRGQRLPPDARPERDLGRRFLELNGRSVFWWLTLARWMCLPFAVLGGHICARWAGDLYGANSAILAAGAWVFAPWILGHGGILSTDVPAASMGLAAAYLFWKGADECRLVHSLTVGVVLGFALLTKFTLIVLPFVLIGWWVVVHVRHAPHNRRWMSLRYMGTLFAIAGVVINAGYGFEGSCRRLREYSFVSTLLGGAGRPAREDYGNRFTAGLLGLMPVPLPENYVRGIDVQRRDFERGLASYAGGRWSDRGWWWYYLYGFAVKTPVGMLCLCGWAACRSGALWGHGTGDQLVLGLLVTLFWFISLQSGFSVHGRYLIPALPFLFIGCSSVLRYNGTPSIWKKRCTLVLCIAAAFESVWSYPHCLSFFNVLAGGPLYGHRHLVDSNISWGQDLFRLAHWLDCHPEVTDLKLLHFGNVNPAIVGVKFRLPSAADVVRDPPDGRPRLQPGWYALDVNYLAGSVAPPMNESGVQDFSTTGLFAWSTLNNVRPYGLVGYTTRIYRILPESGD